MNTLHLSGCGKSPQQQRIDSATCLFVTIILLAAGNCACFGQSVVGWGPVFGNFQPKATNFVAISAGERHGLGLTSDGAVLAWGDNIFGETDIPPDLNDAKAIAAGKHFSLALRRDGRLVQWGIALDIDTNQLQSATDLVALSARGSHALGLRADGTVVGWGQNRYGESDVPPGLFAVIAIAAGDNHSLALKSDGTVVSWGDNSHGQAVVPSNLRQVVSIAAGANHSLAVKADGSLVAWGDNSGGQLLVPSGLTDVVAAAASERSTLSIKSDGTLVAWGDLTRFSIPWDVATAISIAGGNDVYLALTTNLAPILPEQTLRTMPATTELVVTNTALYGGHPAAPLRYELLFAPEGASIDSEGIIRWTPGNEQARGTFVISTEVVNPLAQRRARNSVEVHVHNLNFAPILPPQPDLHVADYSPLVFTNTAVDPNIPPNHLVYTLIEPPPGASIDAVGVIRWSPRPGLVPLTNVFATLVVDDGIPPLSATNSFIVVLPETNALPLIIDQPSSISVGIGRDATLTVYAVGEEPLAYQWQFMGGDLPGATLPTLSLTNAQVSQSGPYRVIVSNDRGSVTSETVQVAVQGVVMWGWSSYNILNAPSTVTNVVGISAGKIHNLALRADGTVVAWGYNVWGECDVPAGLNDVIAVAAGNSHSLALKRDGTLVGWGENSDGNLDFPPELTNAVAIATLQGSSYAIRADGSVLGWGKLVTEMPRELTNVVALATGRDHHLALRADGTLVAWGYYAGGVDRPAFVPAGLSNVAAIAAGFSECLVLRADGSVVAWGYSDSGTQFVQTIPVTNVVAISTFGRHSLALREDGTVLQWGNLIGDIPQPMDLQNVVAISAGGYQSIALLRDGAPHVTVQPCDQTVPESAGLEFVAKVVGMQAMSLQWQFNGEDIPGATADTYSIPEAQTVDAGEYNLVASNPMGTLVSRRAKLNVVAASIPTPLRLSLVSFTNQMFQLQLTGNPGPDYIIETSANLQANWTPLQTNRPASMPWVLTIPNVGSPSTFFRARASERDGF